MGKCSRGTRWVEYRYREPSEKRCLANLSVAGPTERSLPTMLGSNIRPSPLGFKSDSGTKRLGWDWPSEPGTKKEMDGTVRWLETMVDAENCYRIGPDLSGMRSSMNFARQERLTVAIRGGGHNGAGLGVCAHGLVMGSAPIF
jgi:hypothetical protein